MNKRKYPELTALKGKLREEKLTYRSLSKSVDISVNAINQKLNGYSVFDSDELIRVADIANIDPDSVVKFFFPTMLRNVPKYARQ